MTEIVDGLPGVLAAHPEQVRAWRAGVPGAWGFLAGQGVLAARRRAGRPLTETERRAVWQALWDLLQTTHA